MSQLSGEGEAVEGGCHCGAVRFRVRLPDELVAQRCNCSMCSLTGFLHLIVPGRAFTLLSGDAELRTYQFNTGVARHLFCGVCGVKSYYVPRSNPDGFSINLRCLPESVQARTRIEDFDGQNWEAHAADLSHLSRS